MKSYEDIENEAKIATRQAMEIWNANETKLPALTSTTLGNRSMFAQQRPKNNELGDKRRNDNSHDEKFINDSQECGCAKGEDCCFIKFSKFAEPCTSSSKKIKRSEVENFVESKKLSNEIENILQCCAKGGLNGNCLIKAFLNKYGFSYGEALESAVDYITTCRQMGVTDTSNKYNRNQFIIGVFSAMVESDEYRGDQRIFKMKYSIPSLDFRLGESNRVAACLPIVLLTYGITEYEWKTISSSLKECEDGRLGSIHHRKWKDDNLPENMTYAACERAFQNNLGRNVIGNCLIFIH